MPDEPSKGQPTGWTPQTELEHFMQFPVCGEWFDMRLRENVGKHIHDAADVEMVETFGSRAR